jgi:hypothetical protein
MAGVNRWRNDPDRLSRNIRRNKHGSRNNTRRPLGGSKQNSAGRRPRLGWATLPGRWPTDDPVRSLDRHGEMRSANWHNRCHAKRHGHEVPSDAVRQAWDPEPGT